MTINNPLADNSPDYEDQKLVRRARSGDRQALEEPVKRHQAWIYNIAVRMLYHPQDAEDATQEILIRVLTRLSSFEGRSSFRVASVLRKAVRRKRKNGGRKLILQMECCSPLAS
jgi:DNA-directed RNA polymerase specialized sigma24 family protein